MKEVMPKIFVGSQIDYESKIFNPDEWSILLCAKEPWHREALGYSGRAANKNDPEYLMAKRGNKLILNLVDAPKSIFFDKNLIDAGIKFVEEERNKNKNVAFFCNKGESRSSSICLIYLVKNGLIQGDNLEDAEAEFLKLYPNYNPGAGIRGFVKENFEVYKNGQ